MKLFFFSYNIFLIVMYAMASTSCFFAYSYSKKKIYLYSGLTFIFFVLDEFIIYNAEFLLYGTNFNLNVIPHITYPILKILVGTGISIFYLLITFALLKKGFHIKHLLFPMSFFLLSIYLTTLPESVMKLECFYGIQQLYIISLCFFYFYYLRFSTNPDYKASIQPYRIFFTTTFIITIFIALEDIVTIPNMGKLIAYLSIRNVNERNFSEDILSIFFSIMAIKISYKVLHSIFYTKNSSTYTDTNSSEFEKQLNFFCSTYNLTNREKEVIHLLLENKSNQEISDLLYISIGTTKTHVHNIYRKAEVNKKIELLRLFQDTVVNN
ncbi:spore germination protein GerE [Clostridium ragsdalei P11]|uniref:Spore germination protein GerE n=1 Tax=Clostridium ragsdalei P11 TaxID=1353534 RepID=A0A1A6AZQ6_9CLOT|nr:helix-turn-helix transcriptional regulator [Clostridium ragsdalei]OBR95513.1 spore germination protein GerE [Clostridium ragsdalei P11]